MANRVIEYYKHIIGDLIALPIYANIDCYPSFEDIEDGIRNFLNTIKTHDIEYKFSQSANSSTLYSSVYALMLQQLLGIVDYKEDWLQFLNSFQDEDGIWRDKDHPFRQWPERSDEWNDVHLIPHIIYAYEAIDKKPGKPFLFLNKFKDMDYTRQVCNTIAFDGFWAESNGVMNYLNSMIYARDYMNAGEFDAPIKYIVSFLKRKMDENGGLFTKSKETDSLYDSIRGGYHVWMLMIGEGVNFDEDHIKRIIDTILSLQNPMGGFNKRVIADICHNIDCIDPLVRFSLLLPEYRRNEVEDKLELAKRYLLHNRNRDGGFCFSRIYRLRYGNDAHTAKNNESSALGTWFTFVALCIIEDYLHGKHKLQSQIPGMEYRINTSLGR